MSVTNMQATAGIRQPGVAAGIAMTFSGFAIYSMADVAIKWLSKGYPLSQEVFFSCLFSLVPVLAMVMRGSGVRQLATRRLVVHLLRGAIFIAGTFGSFFAYSRIPLADAYAVAFSAPLFITALSVPLLGEAVGWRRWSAVAVGFVGVMIMLRPGAGVINVAALGALGGALGYALSVLIVRRFGNSESTVSFAFYTNLVGLAVSGVMLPGHYVPFPPTDLAIMAGCGLANGIALILVVTGYRWAPAAVAAPFQYTQMLWGVLYGFLIFGDRPDWMLGVGGSIVIASGVYILHRETRRKAGLVDAAVPRAAGIAEEPVG